MTVDFKKHSIVFNSREELETCLRIFTAIAHDWELYEMPDFEDIKDLSKEHGYY